MKLYLVGHTDDPFYKIWNVMGVFTSLDKALEVCYDDMCFIQPIEANITFPIETIPYGYYPSDTTYDEWKNQENNYYELFNKEKYPSLFKKGDKVKIKSKTTGSIQQGAIGIIVQIIWDESDVYRYQVNVPLNGGSGSTSCYENEIEHYTEETNNDK